MKLTTYTGEDVPVAGAITVEVSYNAQEKVLDLLVVRGNGPNLLGRDWLRVLQLDWVHLHQFNKASEKWQEVIDRHAKVFQGVKAKIHVDPKTQLKFYHPVTFPTH